MKGKKGQTHIPFEMIFSLLIIAVFLVVTFFVIKHFLDVKNCADVGLFTRELQESIDEVWKSQESNSFFEKELPSGLKYACFADLKQGINLQGVSPRQAEEITKIFTNLGIYFKYREANFFFYPWQSACSMGANNLQHISFSGNPLCFAEEDGKVRIKLSKRFNEALVRVSS